MRWVRVHRLQQKKHRYAMFFVAEPGLEPRQTEPESAVLPLHNSAIICAPKQKRLQKYCFFLKQQNILAKKCN